MKTTFLTLLTALFCGIASARSIPPDSLYLGQTPPGETPKIFQLPMTNGLRPVERIAITNDGAELFYGELDVYPPNRLKINRFRYVNNAWQGPDSLFGGYLGPALTPDGNTLYMQAIINGSDAVTYYATRNGNSWNAPVKMFSFGQQSHYTQLTNAGNYFMSTVFPGSTSMDVSRVLMGPDTNLVSLGAPICTSINEGDFFMARDESFIIHARSSPTSAANLYISYKRSNGWWTNSKSLGNKINTNYWEYGPFVTADGQYLFFTRGGSAMSTYFTYWVRVDRLIDSLRYTNYLPYVRNALPTQTAYVSQAFSYTLPDSCIVDDDGNNTLLYKASLSSGAALPGWMALDSVAGTFSGIPTETDTLLIKIAARDQSGATVTATLRLEIRPSNSAGNGKEQGFLVFPNPSRGLFRIISEREGEGTVLAEISNLMGKKICSATFRNEGRLDITGNPGGVYLLRLITGRGNFTRKLILE
jgi:hypothetical protein